VPTILFLKRTGCCARFGLAYSCCNYCPCSTCMAYLDVSDSVVRISLDFRKGFVLVKTLFFLWSQFKNQSVLLFTFHFSLFTLELEEECWGKASAGVARICGPCAGISVDCERECFIDEIVIRLQFRNQIQQIR